MLSQWVNGSVQIVAYLHAIGPSIIVHFCRLKSLLSRLPFYILTKICTTDSYFTELFIHTLFSLTLNFRIATDVMSSHLRRIPTALHAKEENHLRTVLTWISVLFIRLLPLPKNLLKSQPSQKLFFWMHILFPRTQNLL